MQAASASSSAMPRRAAIVPGASSPALAMASPRATTRRMPSSKPRAPLATSAVYSPRLCPAHAAGVRPMRSTASSTTRLSTVVASCAFSVWVSSSIGALSNNRDRSRSAATEASSTTSQDGWSTQGSPMPARCEPCPGKVKTNTKATAPIDVGLKEPTVWHAVRAAEPITGTLPTHGAKRGGFAQVAAGYSPETRWDRRCDEVVGAGGTCAATPQGIRDPAAPCGGAYAVALGASAVTQPWRTCSPPGFAVGGGVLLVPEPGPAGTVVVVVVVDVPDGAGVLVVVVLAGTVVVVAIGLTRLLRPGVVVVVVVEDVVVVVGATVVVVVVVLGVAGDPDVADGVVPFGVLDVAVVAAGVGVVITAVVQ